MNQIFAVAPALPLHTAGKYVAGAYIVFVALVLVYVAIMAVRLSRTERELAELRRELLEQRAAADDPAREQAGREPGRSSETGGRAMLSGRGVGGPAEDYLA